MAPLGKADSGQDSLSFRQRQLSSDCWVEQLEDPKDRVIKHISVETRTAMPELVEGAGKQTTRDKSGTTARRLW